MVMKMEKRNKREMLRKQVLELYARGIEVYQTQIDNAVDIDDISDEIILSQINSLKELRDKHPRLTRSINEDLNVLMSQVNCVDIKNYNKINFLISNDVEEQMIEILHWLSIFENAQLTEKQKDLLIDIVSGFSYEGRHKSYNFLINKLEKSKGGVNKMSNDSKRKFTNDEMRKLFPSYYNKENDYWDCYLNYSRKLSCYTDSVNESKRNGDRLRALSLATAILPLELECGEQLKENLD